MLWVCIASAGPTNLAAENDAIFTWGFMPPPLTPADNHLTPARVALGKRLFHDTRLSVTGTHSCATCHQPERHFTDGLPRALGATGQTLLHNTPTLYFTAFNASFGWTDTGATTLEQQHHTPLFNQSPVEMGFSDNLLAPLRADQGYQAGFADAYGEISSDTLIKAIASYVRTITPPPTAFDRYLFHDDRTAMSKQASAGMELFFSARLGCSQCHASLTFSGPVRHTKAAAEPVFHSMGVGGSSNAFRAPTLRQIAHTAPYMHDGSLTSLQQVVAHYTRRPSERVPAFSLTSVETQQLIAFLQVL